MKLISGNASFNPVVTKIVSDLKGKPEKLKVKVLLEVISYSLLPSIGRS